MLQSLHVKNLALIDEAEVDFTEGLNILSGETGAGKSIIIGSINLALGEKVQKEMLKDASTPGETQTALVELIFRVTDPRIVSQLAAMEIYPEDDEVIFSRKIVNGRGTAKINGESIPASKVREIAAVLIDIHGQHEHQSLLSKKKHLEILDDYAGAELETLKEQLAETYHTYRALLSEQQKADVGVEERMREISFLEYEIKEIEDAALREGEDEELEADYRRVSNSQKIVGALGNAYGCTGGEMDAASALIGRALHEISGVSSYDEKIAQMEQELVEIDNLLNDFNREISDYMDDQEFDDEAFYQMEKRLDLINHMKSKYGSTIPEIMQALEEKQERLVKLQDYDSYLADLQGKIDAAREVLDDLCKKVSDIRKSCAVKLTAAVTEALQELNFLDVRFEMHFEKLADYTAIGYDDAEFLISTYPGEPIKPLG